MICFLTIIMNDISTSNDYFGLVKNCRVLTMTAFLGYHGLKFGLFTKWTATFLIRLWGWWPKWSFKRYQYWCYQCYQIKFLNFSIKHHRLCQMRLAKVGLLVPAFRLITNSLSTSLVPFFSNSWSSRLFLDHPFMVCIYYDYYNSASIIAYYYSSIPGPVSSTKPPSPCYVSHHATWNIGGPECKPSTNLWLLLGHMLDTWICCFKHLLI